MKWLSYPVTGILAVVTLSLLIACGGKSKLESCKFVEIEDPEFEVEFGDVDVEGGEVEMVCGDQAKPGTAWSRKARRCAIALSMSPGINLRKNSVLILKSTAIT